MKRFVITGFFILLETLGFTQGEFNNWNFGTFAGLNFNNSPPTPLLDNNTLMGVQSSVSDSIGNLLFYSTGSVVCNRNKLFMPNGMGLLSGGYADAQHIFTVQSLSDDRLYYLFTMGTI